LENYLLFIITALLIIIVPGPDFALVTKNTITYGKEGGFKTVAGIVTALFIHTLLATCGLSALIMKSAVLFSILKLIGAIYLIYLAIHSFRSALKRQRSQLVKEEWTHHCKTKPKNFKEGFLTNIFNPKVAVFFLSFLPQFISKDEHHFLQFLALGVIFIALSVIWYFFYISLIKRLNAFMQTEKVSKAMEVITGTVLLGFGIRMVLEKQ